MEKKLRILLAFLLISVAQVITATQILDWDTGLPKEGLSVSPTRVLTPQHDGFVVTYTFPTYTVTEDSRHPSTYRFSIDNFDCFIEPGTYINSRLLRVVRQDSFVISRPILIKCESINDGTIDVSYHVDEDSQIISLSATNILTGESVNIPELESGDNNVQIQVNSSGNYAVVLRNRDEIIDSRKIVVK